MGRRKRVIEPLDVNCRTRRGLELLSDKWTLLVLISVREEALQFSQILAHLEGISKKMLTQTLRGLERNGLVSRVVYPVIPPMVEYSLTPLGQTLIEPIWALRDWSEQYIDEVERAREAYDRRDHTHLQDQIALLVQQRVEEASTHD
jgi:DNA-binding HxlR family transcriptional regulator